MAERNLRSAPSQENVQIVQRVMRFLARAEPEAALADVHPEATLDWSDSNAPDRGVYVGTAAWSGFLRARNEVLADRRFDSLEFITPADDTVVVVGRVQERGRASGIELETRGAAVWTLSEGKIVHFKIYQSRADALRAVGLDA
jgi:ketosteroid isomerase-like protein